MPEGADAAGRPPGQAAGAAPSAPRVLLGFDYGTHLIGVAVGNTLTGDARPLCSVDATRRDERFAAIGALIREWQPAMLVVGLPLAREGSEQLRTTQARRFANQLHGRFGVPVAMVDERWTSREAEDSGADDVDAESARLILEQYLRHDRSQHP